MGDRSNIIGWESNTPATTGSFPYNYPPIVILSRLKILSRTLIRFQLPWLDLVTCSRLSLCLYTERGSCVSDVFCFEMKTAQVLVMEIVLQDSEYVPTRTVHFNPCHLNPNTLKRQVQKHWVLV